MVRAIDDGDCVSFGPTGASSPRLLVLEVYEADRNVKHVRAVETRVNVEINIELHDDWAETAISCGYTARVILVTTDGTYFPWRTEHQKEKPIIVNQDDNFFIAHPDTLVSGTAVSDSFRCLRKSVITARCPPSLPAGSFIGQAALFGSMIHDLFQNILVLDSNTRDYSTAQELSQMGGVDIMSFFELVEDVVSNHADELFAASISLSHTRQVLHKVIPQIVTWYETFMGFGNYNNTTGVSTSAGKMMRNVIVTKVHDIEELVWSPVLGLKGKIDASVHLRIDDQHCGIAVLELKSGKGGGYSAVSHSAQVSLYNLLLSDRNSAPVRQGLLTYIRYQEALQAVRDSEQKEPSKPPPPQQKGGTMDHRLVIPPRAETVGLIMQRNRIAAHLRIEADIEDLPPLLQGSPDTCEMCFASDSCLVQHKLLENGCDQSAEAGPGKELFRSKTMHLSHLHMHYYTFWRNVLADEEEYAARNSRHVWAMEAGRKEAVGKCVSNLVLLTQRDDNGNESPHQLLPPGQRTIAEFQRHFAAKDFSKNLLSSGVSVGDFVVVSAQEVRSDNGRAVAPSEGSETWQCALTNGFVHSLTPNTIFVTVDRSLGAWVLHQHVEVADVIWRIDAEEIFSSHNTAKRTLDTLFYSDEAREGMKRLRELIIDRREPMFHHETAADVNDVVLKVDDDQGNSDHEVYLNEDQLQALRLSLRAIDYLLILGMPGTGKTATLAAIVIAHAKRGRSVLLCSHTNSAVDNLLLRLLNLGFDDFVRLGRNLNVVDEKIRRFHMSTIKEEQDSMEDVERVVMSKQVVATTCLGINHWVLERQKQFDIVVVDEASQMLQPICIGPLQYVGGSFVLVGDHYQLAPLQRAGEKSGRRQGQSGRRQGRQIGSNTGTSESAHNIDKKTGMNDAGLRSDESLFRRLCGRRPETMVLLSRQYRMAKDIMRLCNEVVYGGSLQCGNEEVSMQRLSTDYTLGTETRGGRGRKDKISWLHAVRDSGQQVVFVDCGQTESIGETNKVKVGKQSRESDVENQAEASVVAQCVHQLVKDGVSVYDVTVLTPFRAQVEFIRGKLRHEATTRDCQVSTIDQYQGKDNKCVMISMVKRGEGGIGPLMRDWKRLNVAMTRAKEKLIIVGCAETLSKGSHFLEYLMKFLKANDMIVTARR